MQDYVKDYFDRNAPAWVEGAYGGGSKFPVGAERVGLLRPGGSLAVCARTRHYNVVGATGYPGRELERGDAGALPAELIEALAQPDASGMHAPAEELAAAAPELAEAARRDAAE